MTLREMAYERDPRIAAERVQELYEKELRKLAKKEGYEKRQKELLDRQEARESVKKQAEDAKLAEAQKISDDKKAAQKRVSESAWPLARATAQGPRACEEPSGPEDSAQKREISNVGQKSVAK